jgi:hypothetical protein
MSAYLAGLLEEVGVPVARGGFKTAQSPPYIVYVFAYSSNYAADSSVYVKRGNYQVELYIERKDPALEETLEGVFDGEGIFYDKTETAIESEGLIQIVYEIQLLGG